MENIEPTIINTANSPSSSSCTYEEIVEVEKEKDANCCMFCSKPLTSPEHVMLRCKHIFHVHCFLQMYELGGITCRCVTPDVGHPATWGRDQRTTLISQSGEQNKKKKEEDNDNNDEEEREAKVQFFSALKTSISSMFTATGQKVSKREKGDIPNINQISNKALQEAIKSGKLPVEELVNQECTFQDLVERGVTVGDLFQGGNSLEDIQRLHVSKLGQLLLHGFQFSHLKEYSHLTTPEMLSGYSDAGVGVFQQFGTNADAFLRLGYTPAQLQHLGLTIPKLLWKQAGRLTPLGVVTSPYEPEDFVNYLGMTPQLARTMGITRRMAKAHNWPVTMVEDKKREPYRTTNTNVTGIPGDFTYRQVADVTHNPYKHSSSGINVIKYQ